MKSLGFVNGGNSGLALRGRAPRRRAWIAVAFFALGCADTIGGQTAVGGQTSSPAELDRFVRRLYLDVTAQVPDESEAAEAVADLSEQGNDAAVRMSLVDQLLEQPEAGTTFVAELENRLFAGQTLDALYEFYCGVIRVNSAYPECNTCASNPDPCAECACYLLDQLFAERNDLRAAAADLAAGTRTTGDIERAYASSQILRLSTGQAVVDLVFETFLGRPPETDERLNATNMLFGSPLGLDRPAGVLFHRYGDNYDDLIDIIFRDEAYREAVVDRVFIRYLGRRSNPEERSYLTAQVDPERPDALAIVRAVLSSREYFEQ